MSKKQSAREKYFEEFGLSVEDQEWIDRNITTNKESNRNVIDNGSVFGTYKRGVNRKLTSSKYKYISELDEFNYLTPPKEIANCLDKLFAGWGTYDGYWLYVAQNYTPRTIRRVIRQIIKSHQRREISIKNPAALFSFLLKFRKKRKKFKGTNGTRKRES